MVIKNNSTILFLGFSGFKFNGWSVPGETLGTFQNFRLSCLVVLLLPGGGGILTKVSYEEAPPRGPTPFLLYTIFDRLRAVSLFSWSLEQNARDTQMITPSFLARVYSPTNSEEKKRLLAVYISDRKVIPFVYLPLTNCTPFKYLV